MVNNIAHRGFSKFYPENTMIAFQMAVEAGCDAIELDLQVTKDGELVIFHDDTLERTTTGVGLISEFTKKELMNLSASKLFYGKLDDQKIPSLEEYLHYIRGKNIISVIELKKKINADAKMEEKVIEMIRSFGLGDKVILSSFSQESILRSRILAPEISTALITDYWLYRGGSVAKSLGASYIHPRHLFLLPFVLSEMKKEGILVQPWTVDTENRMRWLIRAGVNGIITNDPKLLHEVIQSM
ncbi:glycerophosphodiester phosphodiesterase family protein [Proteiniclasticum sp.]|uniref:glycerophosphodiester phosphodiesterase n=1 Tax=Proteiniclasticum sp. TaxID=2053595 RepID=UPI0028A05501|nr:glycerophosphodiester phosphodiesterase family protein [Proteiniclasticum sp.]